VINNINQLLRVR
jgi:hypothetical protein